MTPFTSFFTPIIEHPLFWLTTTLVIFQAAQWLYVKARAFPLLNPVFTSIVTLAVFVTITDTPYSTYFAANQLIHVLLGPATVALAAPLYKQLATLRATALPIVLALGVGAVTGIVSAVVLARVFSLSQATILSLAPKSITTPIAMGIAEQIGGSPTLTAALVITTGIVGAVCGLPLLRLVGIQDDATKGFAIGLAAHGIGTARALQASDQAGAFAGLAMGLNGVLTALLVPMALYWLGIG
ncbi:MAG: LrgB family protein [Deinococcota bacterium]